MAPLSVNIREFPEDLYKEIKKLAIDRGVTLRDIMIEAARELVKSEAKRRGRK